MTKAKSWKDGGVKKSSMIKDKSARSRWKQRMKQKEDRKAVQEYERTLKEEAARQKEEKRKRIEEKQKKKEENERKSEVVQVIRNPAKLKRLSKKQWKKIRKS
ncbi:coiled-coil domain-containing protein 86-like [Oscarella lobularis]|uniref:coiled-coil domain-containing protein 86-like n=1 Tax=Oscarella lobularis TaxID=121494 RepID=UPI003313DD54